jgi:predicted ArsR family transcriptional regulator
VTKVLGPAPVRSGTAGSALSSQRAAVLEFIQHHEQPASVIETAQALGLHANSAREHLDALVDRGLLQRFSSKPKGPGRPAWLYRAVAEGEPDSRVAAYTGLVRALAEELQHSDADAVAFGLAAGARWGRRIADGHPDLPDGELASERVVALLAAMAYDPDVQVDAPDDPPIASTTDGATPSGGIVLVRLRRCPVLDAAAAHPEVVCSIHLGMVRGVLAALGAPDGPTELVPFAEPGACRLTLPA